MINIQTKRYKVQNKNLANVIYFYWQIESPVETVINHNLLPINNTDLILNFSTPIEYIVKNKVILAPDFHFYAMKKQSYSIRQNGKINVFGVSFLPHGLYQVVQKPMSIYNGKIVDIRYLNLELMKCIQSHDFCHIPIDKKINLIENSLLKDINLDIVDQQTMKRLKDFYLVCHDMKISDFCIKNNISAKQFERIFLRVVGVTPKQFQCLNRYQRAVNSIIYDKDKNNLSELAYSLNYYDQTHFNKDFLKYSGYNPTTFKKCKPSVKQNSELV